MALLLGYIKKYKGTLLLALVLASINQIFSLLDPQITRILIDNYATKFDQIESSVFFKGVALLLLAFISVAFISRIAKNFQDYFVSAITQHVGTDMYSDSVDHTFSLPFSVFEDRRSGEVLQKMLKARQDSQALIGSMINLVFVSVVGMLFVLTYAFYVHWSIGLTFFLTIPLISIVVFIISRRIKESQKEIVRESAELSGATTETLRNVELVKSLGLESQEIQRLNDVNDKILKLELKKIKFIRMLSFLQGTIVNAMRAGLIFLMFYLIYNGQITVGEFLSLFFYSFFIFAPLGELATVITQYQEAKASTEQLEEIFKIKPRAKPQNAKKIGKIDSIEFKDISFKYSSSEKHSLKDINLKMRGGETIAFVGPSGSGKTTMTKLLLGLYEFEEGSLNFNDISSKKIDFDLLRNRIGLVSQETQLFAGTIRENLLFVSPKATDDECVDALKKSSALQLIQRGGKGLDTKIGEGGLKLSGGEKQRLAIARAILRKPDIIVFDEATSSLDSLTEKDITQTIKDISKTNKNLITVIIAHRLSTILHSDKIYVLEKGSVVESGTHESLLRKRGLYSALWREQIAESD